MFICLTSTRGQLMTFQLFHSFFCLQKKEGLLVAGLFFTDYPPSWEKIPPVEDPGLRDPLGEPGWLSW